jgi:hypothetical protein
MCTHVVRLACRHGVEYTDVLEWRKWQPGGEYTKNILVKNTSGKVRLCEAER